MSWRYNLLLPLRGVASVDCIFFKTNAAIHRSLLREQIHLIKTCVVSSRLVYVFYQCFMRLYH